MSVIKNALIKEIKGPDLVFVVNNLPYSLIYRKAKKLVPLPRFAVDYDRTDPKMVEAYTLRNEDAPDEPRNRRLTGELVDELLPGIELSQTGDGGFVFHVEYNEAKERLAAIDRYIQSVSDPMARIPSRVPYAAQEGSFSAQPKSLSQIPRVELPEPVSPPASSVQVHSSPESKPVIPADTANHTLEPKKRKPMSEENKVAARIRLQAAREKKRQKELEAKANS